MIHLIGGAGFLGTRLAKVLQKTGQPFRIFDKTLSGDSFVDVTCPKSLAKLPTSDVIINLAAEHRDDVTPRSRYDIVNVEGAKNICNYCRNTGVNTIVFTSTVAVYGFASEGTDESGCFSPFNDYGRTKMEAEAVYREWLSENTSDRSLVIVRPSVIFGEQNRGNVYNLFKQIASKRFIMFGDGKNRKSMAYVENVAEFLSFSLNFGAGEHIYNYIDKPDLDMNELVCLCRSQLFRKQGVGLRLPRWVGVLMGYGFDIIAMLIRKKLPVSAIRVKKFMGTTSFDTSLAETGFKPKISLREGVARTLTYEFLEDNSTDKVFFTE